MGNTLPADTLATARLRAQDHMDQTVQVQRPSHTRTATGGRSDAFTTIYTAIQARVVSYGVSNLIDESGTLHTILRWLVSLPYGSNMQSGDVLTIGTRKLTVQHVYDPSSYSLTARALCVEVRAV